MTEPTVRRQMFFLEGGLERYLSGVDELDAVGVIARKMAMQKAKADDDVAWWALRVYASTNWNARPLWWKLQPHRFPSRRIVLRYRWP